MVANRRTDPLQQLPANVVPKVVRHVPASEWPFLRLVCKFWKEAVNLEITVLKPRNWNLSIAKKFPKLRRLDLDDSLDKVGAKGMLRILSQLPELRAITNWPMSPMPPSTSLGSMVSRFAQLDEIGVTRCPNGCDLKLLKHVPNLRILKLEELKFSFQELHEGFQDLKSLTSIEFKASYAEDFDKGPGIWAALFQPVSKEHIKALQIARTGGLFMRYYTLEPFTSLTKLDVSYTYYGDEGIEALNALTKLTFLNISGSKISSKGVAVLTALTRLQSLAAYQCRWRDIWHGPHGRNTLETFPILRRLDLSSAWDLRDLSLYDAVPNLTCLKLTHCHKLKSFRFLSNLTQLQELHASIADNDCLQGLKGLVDLRSLHLSCRSTPTAPYASIACLRGLKGLEELSLGGFSDITDRSLHWLRTLPKLTKLDLSMCVRITSAGLRKLEILPLEWLRCQGVNIIEEDLPPKLQLALWRGHRGCAWGVPGHGFRHNITGDYYNS